MGGNRYVGQYKSSQRWRACLPDCRHWLRAINMNTQMHDMHVTWTHHDMTCTRTWHEHDMTRHVHARDMNTIWHDMNKHVVDNLMGPYIIPPRLDTSKYLVCLQEILLEMLHDVYAHFWRKMFIQHWAPAHYARNISAIFTGLLETIELCIVVSSHDFLKYLL